ncbi:MAG: phage tail protein [Burkholderiales bacterium]|nr:phage tail protein [Burkholderiales bacterium]
MNNNDCGHWFGSDLQLTPIGGIALAAQIMMQNQRIVRRLLTNPGAYIFEPTYGAGLGQYIGQLFDQRSVTAVIVDQLALEVNIATTPAPTVTVTPIVAGFQVQILYYLVGNPQVVPLSFAVTPPGTQS